MVSNSFTCRLRMVLNFYVGFVACHLVATLHSNMGFELLHYGFRIGFSNCKKKALLNCIQRGLSNCIQIGFYGLPIV